ncbi:MAG: nitroreductase family protein [Ruminococcaceae bacterium]|nr:nitroreductase family protein [Oscillospiraceae bacterium]
MNSIMKRRSIRKYLDKAVEADKIERILRAAMQSPTGHNAQDWEFIVVTEKEMLKNISELGPYSGFAAEAPLQIVVCANQEKAWHGGTWPSNMGAVCQTILLQVEEEGLGACWIANWPYPERMAHVKNALDIPDHVIPYAVISIGYKQYEKRFDDRFDPEKIHWEKY